MRRNTYPYCFLSVAVNYSYHHYRKIAPWKINNAKDIMLDSGGFSFLNRFGDYPFSINVFVDWVDKMNDVNDGKVNFVATPDYPCEMEITRTCGLKTNYERIIATVDKAIECLDGYPDINWLPVIQGYELSEYELCLDLYKERGVNPVRFAIGSLCRRKKVEKIEFIVKSLISRGLDNEIHIFGLCMNGLKSKYLFDNVASCDNNIYAFKCKTEAESFKVFDETLKKIDGYLLVNKNSVGVE